MFAGKIQNSANRVTKRPMFVVLFCLLFVFSLAGFTFSSPANLQPVQPELFIMTRNVQTYDLDATQWNFPMLLVFSLEINQIMSTPSKNIFTVGLSNKQPPVI